ncbi:MAG: toprim domain-containing protein [Desulfobacteraceae bacterium]|nr:toprim domain-containing protein [Desulfobacteraceae bacterium]
MSDDFEKVKREVTIRQVIEHFDANANIGRTHVNPSICCDHNDCMSLVGDNGYKCYSCDTKGSIIDLVMAREGLRGDPGQGEALKLLAGIFNIELTPPSGSGLVKEKKEQAEGGKEKALRLAVKHCLSVRENGAGDDAVKYFLHDRGHSDETMEFMQMGWTDGGMYKALKAEDFTLADLVSYGLVVDKDKDKKPLKRPRDFFWKKGMAVFPIFDHAGKVVSLTVKDPEKKFTAQQMKGIKKDWFINHAALGKYNDLFIVEGQHDMASLIDVGFKNVVGTCGGPGNDQVKKVKNHCAGKRVYLWFDKDPDKDPKKSQGGPAHTRFIYEALKESSVEVRIIMHPGETKDPDDYIQGLLKDKDKAAAKKAIKELMEAALSPLEWEIELLKLIKNDKDRLVIMKERNIPQEINGVTCLISREGYIDQLAIAINRTVKAVEDFLENVQDLYSEIDTKFRGNIKGADPLSLATYIYEWFERNAGKFVKTSDDKGWLHYHGTTYELGDNNPFNGLMLRLTRLLRPVQPGAAVWYALATLCETRGEPVDMMSWVHTCRKTNTIYYNLNSAHQKIIRVAEGEEPIIIDNGTNEQGVLLLTSPQIKQFTYNPTTSEAEGFRALKTHLMDSTPCDLPQRYFMACWTISVFLINLQSDRGLLQVIGSSGLGKSKVAERISQLVYGENYLGSSTGAADVRIATKSPVVFLDNVENRDLSKGKIDFMLLLATSTMKPKAAAGSDTEVIYQKLNAMGIITAIEPFPGKYPELINRTFPLILIGREKKKGYMHDEVMRAILKDRDVMLSAIFMLIGKKVLPKLADRTYWSQFLQSEFAGHNKERMNEHLCTMMVILEALLEYIPIDKSEKDTRKQASIMLKDWINCHEAQAEETAVDSNVLLTFLNAIMNEVLIRMKGRKIDYEDNHPLFKDCKVKAYLDEVFMHEFYLTEKTMSLNSPEDEESYMKKEVHRFELVVSSAELNIIFDRLCKGVRKNHFDNATALGHRITNDLKLINKNGWQNITTEKWAPKFKKRNGVYYWRFSKEIEATKW